MSGGKNMGCHKQCKRAGPDCASQQRERSIDRLKYNPAKCEPFVRLRLRWENGANERGSTGVKIPEKQMFWLALAGLLLASIAVSAQPDSVPAAGVARAADPLAPPAPDLAAGARRYNERCASCHDNPTGRIPARSVIADNTRPFIVSVLAEGIMQPMVRGLAWSDIGSIASYLAKRPGGDVTTSALESPLCSGHPQPLSLSGPQWNGWGADGSNTRFQPEPGLTHDDIAHLKVKWAFYHAGGRSGQATIAGGRVFVNSSSGSIYSLDAKTGCSWWRLEADAGSRTSIVVGACPGMAPARYAAYSRINRDISTRSTRRPGRLLGRHRSTIRPACRPARPR